MSNYYNEISKGYEELHKEEQLKKIAVISKYIKPKSSDFLLDVGCGTGLTTAPWNCNKIGIDPAASLLEKAREKHKDIRFIKAEAEKIPFKDDYFDIVISITAIQNFNDIEKGLREIKRVGKSIFAMSALKRSEKISSISKLIKRLFKVKEIIEEDKDIIFIAHKTKNLITQSPIDSLKDKDSINRTKSL